jgi:hypothetical protein
MTDVSHKNMRLIPFLFLFSLITTMSAQQQPTTPSAEAMRELRLRMLTDDPKSFGVTPTEEYPVVYGVLMDWPIDEHTASVVSLCTGDASLYTTSTFGVIGGIGHDSVRSAAHRFLKEASKHYDESVPTSDYPYPASDRVRFYLVTFNGVRVIDAPLSSATDDSGKYAALFYQGQEVITQLRLVTQTK